MTRQPNESIRRRVTRLPVQEVLAGRGFILLRTGFLGGGITSALPPLAVIFSRADFEK
jgi:hypothetical protein